LCSGDRGRRQLIKDYVGRVPLTHHMMFATGRTSRPALRGTPFDQGLDVVPGAKCNLQFYNWFGKVSLSTDHIASISCDPMRILFALHSHRIGTKVPLTLKRLLQLVTLDGAVDLGIADPDQDRSRVLSDAEVALLWPSLDLSCSCSPARGQGRSEPWSAPTTVHDRDAAAMPAALLQHPRASVWRAVGART
jgi:hypothetical protein